MIRIDQYQIGVDEVGRGAWAGPIVGAAVWFPQKVRIPRYILLRDSKVLSALQREKANDFIIRNSLYCISHVSRKIIDTYGIHKAHSTLLQKCVFGLHKLVKKHYIHSKNDGKFRTEHPTIFIDGRRICTFAQHHEFIEKGDSKYQVIASASIIAKVARDRIMRLLSRTYPRYGFDSHVGYGTKMHQEALRQYGPCPEHRRSYRPIRNLL